MKMESSIKLSAPSRRDSSSGAQTAAAAGSNKKGERQVLYRLREVLEAPIVFVPQGERMLRRFATSFVATTNAGGAKAPWLPEYTESLRGREVILLPDNDPRVDSVC